MAGTYKRSYYQRQKSAKLMRKYWANRRKSEAMKKRVAERKAAGITHHTNGMPYKDMVNATIKQTNELNKLEQLFGEGRTFKDLTPEQRTQYYRAIDKRIVNKTKAARVERVIASKPIELLISISVIGDKTQKSLNVVSLVPSQS